MGIFRTGVVAYLYAAVCGLALISSAACSPHSQNTINTQDNQGIIGGVPVGDEDRAAESTVGIIHKVFGELHCTGTLIGKNLVMTAAHCTTQDPEMLAIQFDRTRALTEADLEKKIIRQVIAGRTHPQWAKNDFSTLGNWGDIAILRFEGELPDGFKPARINFDPELIKNRDNLLLVGFGLTDGHLRTRSLVLNKTLTPVENAHFTETEFLADQRLGTGVCKGDSGGPAYAIGADEELILVGVTSRGYEDERGTCDVFGLFSSTAGHAAWIHDTSIALQSEEVIGEKIPQPF